MLTADEFNFIAEVRPTPGPSVVVISIKPPVYTGNNGSPAAPYVAVKLILPLSPDNDGDPPRALMLTCPPELFKSPDPAVISIRPSRPS